MSAAFLSARRLWVSWLAAGAAVIWNGPALCQPGTLERHAAIYDSGRQRMIVFGGIAGTQPTNGAWELTLSGAPRWMPLAPTGSLPSKRFGHSAVYDPLRERMIVFGGQAGASVLDDVWALSASGPATWDSLQPSGPRPPGRLHHTAIYDPVRDRMVIHGGSDSFGIPFGDVWCLWLAPAPRWEQIWPSGTAPAERFGHSAIYDPVRDRMVAFSGGGFATNDVWALSLGGQPAWTPLQPPGNRPLHRVGHAAIYDPRRDRMIVFGGYAFNQYLNDVWELPLTGPAAWSPILEMGDPPSPRGFHSAVYDSAYDRTVVFGGIPNVSEPTWAFSLWPPMRWSPFRPAIQVSAAVLQLGKVTLGDTVSVPFQISNIGLEPLQVTDFRLPTTAMRLSSPAPLGLAWREAVPETLFLAASEPRSAQDSMVIVSNDPLVPRRHVTLRLDVLGLDFETRVLGDPLEVPLGASVVVVVTPKPGVIVERSTLYYRIADGTSAFDSLSFTPLATDFIAAIPASAVTEHGVEYYVKVENSGFVATAPLAAPGTVFTQPVAAPVSVTAVPRPTSGSDFLAGRDIEVEVLLPAGASFVSGTIQFRQGGEQSYETDTLALGGVLGRPLAIIPGRAVGPRGVEYWVEVRTLKSTLQFPDTGLAPAIIRVKVQDLAEQSDHPGARYRLLTVPLDFGTDFSGSLDALLTDQLGTYDPVRWRAYAYDAASERNVEFSPAEAARFRPEPGRAFWLISREAHRVDTKPIHGFSTPTGREYPIALAQGWNLFGNPFDFPVAWSEVRKNEVAVGDPVAFDPSLGRIGDYAGDAPSVLAPFQGYFIHATQPESLWVPPRATLSLAAGNDAPSAGENTASTTSPAAKEDPGSSWRLQVQAWTDQSVDGSNVLGLHSGAAEGFDPLDWPKPPPPPGPWVQVAFVHPEWQERSGHYRRDLRGPGSEGQTWEIEVRNSTSGDPVTLELSEIVPAPSGLALRLIDREQGSSVDWLRGAEDGQGRLRYRLLGFGPRPYRLAIVAGTEEYVARATQQALTAPLRVTLDQNAPNPFRAATRIRFGLPRAEQVTLEIFSVVGQRVAAPLERVPFAPGYHAVVWDGTISSGGRAPSGVYLMRFAAGRESLMRRLVLVR